jgi:hypothetical protein
MNQAALRARQLMSAPPPSAARRITEIVESPLNRFFGAGSFDVGAQALVEEGGVLYCPALEFEISENEARLFDPRLSDGKRKSIYLRGKSREIFGSSASDADNDILRAMLERYRDSAMELVLQLFPTYRGAMLAASTSFRPRPTGVGEASLSWRKDDTRMHVDAFPSNPTHGVRILRVFTNVGAKARVWRVGERFESMADHFLPRVPEYSLWRAQWLKRLGVTKRLRSHYDHIMLHLHDAAKADLKYQRESPQTTIEFAPGSSWICFSDQVMHAAMAGQFMLEQTVHVALHAMAHPEHSPLAVLERAMLTPLLPHRG